MHSSLIAVLLERNVEPNTFVELSIRNWFDCLGGNAVLNFDDIVNRSWVREFYCNIHPLIHHLFGCM